MRDLLLLAVQLVVTFARLMRPGGLRAVIAESLLLLKSRNPKMVLRLQFAPAFGCLRPPNSLRMPGSRIVEVYSRPQSRLDW